MTSQFQLIMRSGPTPGAAYTLEGDQITIGRDSTNEIVINDAEISRRHARLTFQGGKYFWRISAPPMGHLSTVSDWQVRAC